MGTLALNMLLGDRGKYVALVVGLTLATLLLSQQASIFFGLLMRSTGPLQNIGQPDLWVADRDTTYIGNVRPIDLEEVNRVRSIPGVEWAEPLFVSRAIVEIPGAGYEDVQIIGVDRTTMVGRPPEITGGRLKDLRIPDAVLVQESARKDLGDPEIGETLILNDRRAVVVGYCVVQAGFQADAILYTTFTNALQFVPLGRDRVSFVLVGVREGADVGEVKRRISAVPALRAFTPADLRRESIEFIVKETGIGVNFGITVALGVVIGLIVSAAIFYQFVTDNIRHFATLKIMGTTNGTLVRMILTQAVFSGLIGYGVGTGLAGAFSYLGREPGSKLDVFFPWQLLVGAFAAVLLVVCVASFLSIWKALRLEPGMVFR